jgi:hypothetical protein
MLSATTLTGIVDGYRRTAASRSALVLIIANLIPLGGVLFFGWSLWTILVLYWLENGIVGVWAVARILTAAGPVVPGTAGMALTLGQVMPAVRPFVAAFFLVHYGLFWLVHGVFVFALPGFLGLASGASLAGVGSLSDGGPAGVPALDPNGFPIFVPGAVAGVGFGEIVWSSVALGAAAFFLSHGLSFFVNYLGRGERFRTSPLAQAAAPYGRVVVLHVTILFGGFAIAFLGAPVLLLVVMVLAKTAFDLSLHLREHPTALE